MNRGWKRLLLAGCFLLALASATYPHPAGGTAAAATLARVGDAAGSGADAAARPYGWTEESHGNGAEPNYGVVFPRDRVNEITIKIALEDWGAMFDDTGALLDAQEAAGGPVSWERMWVPATLEFNGMQWTNVGVRHKGSSSRWAGWVQGTLKMPLKLDFDQFEDEHPETRNQRFYGFKQLSFANNVYDGSLLRDVLAYDLFREAGLAAPQAAHYNITVLTGPHRISLGMYTAIEVIDDTVVERHFGDDSGNIYEGDGPAASLAAGAFENTSESIGGSFWKKNNREAADWSDVEALYSILHSAQRTSNPEAWRASLESVFDVNGFLKWLAIGSLLDHSDTYGYHPHNYYIYNNPATGLLTWIPWDHDRILSGRDLTTLDRVDVGAEWPLIRYLLDQPAYYSAYVDYLAEMVEGPYDPDRMEMRVWEMAGIVRYQAAQESGELAYRAAVEWLIQVIRGRAEAAKDFLSG